MYHARKKVFRNKITLPLSHFTLFLALYSPFEDVSPSASEPFAYFSCFDSCWKGLIQVEVALHSNMKTGH